MGLETDMCKHRSAIGYVTGYLVLFPSIPELFYPDKPACHSYFNHRVVRRTRIFCALRHTLDQSTSGAYRCNAHEGHE